MPNSSNSLSRGTRLVYAAQSLTEIKAAYADTLRHYLEGTKKFDNITSYMGCSFLQGSDGVVHGTPQAIAYKYHNQTNMVAVFYVNSQNFPMVLTSGDGLNAGSHKLLPLGKDPQNVYLGWFRPEESMVPYYLSDSKGDIFYLFYKRNGTLHYAAFDAFGADPIDGGVDHDLGLEMVDYVSIVAGPQGSAKPYLFWNTPKSGISNEIPSYLNTCQLQLNNSDPNYKNYPTVSIIPNTGKAKLTQTVYAPSATYVDRGSQGQYFVIFHSQPLGNVHDTSQPKRLQGYVLPVANTNGIVEGNYAILSGVTSAGKRGDIGYPITGATAPCAWSDPDSSTLADVYLLDDNNRIQIIIVDLAELKPNATINQGTMSYIASPKQTKLPFNPVGAKNCGISVVRTLTN